MGDLVSITDLSFQDLDTLVALAKEQGTKTYSYEDPAELRKPAATPDEIIYARYVLHIGRITVEYFNLDKPFMAIRYSGEPIDTRVTCFKDFIEKFTPINVNQSFTDKHLKEQAFAYGLDHCLGVAELVLMVEKIKAAENSFYEINPFILKR